MQETDVVKVIKTDVLPGNKIAPPFKLSEHYTIKSTHVCKCGELHIDVGLVSEINFVTCHKCREQLPNGQPEGSANHWAHSSRFELVHQ